MIFQHYNNAVLEKDLKRKSTLSKNSSIVCHSKVESNDTYLEKIMMCSAGSQLFPFTETSTLVVLGRIINS